MLSTDATTLLGTVMEVTMFSEPSLPSRIMFESSTATEESTSADLASSPHPVLVETRYSWMYRKLRMMYLL